MTKNELRDEIKVIKTRILEEDLPPLEISELTIALIVLQEQLINELSKVA